MDEDLLEDSRNRITTWLQERGYWRARVSYSRRQTDDRPRGRLHDRAWPRVPRAVAADRRRTGAARGVPPAAHRDRDRLIPSCRPCWRQASWRSRSCTRTAVFRRRASSRHSSTSVPRRSRLTCRATWRFASGSPRALARPSRRITFEGVQALDETALRSALTMAPGPAVLVGRGRGEPRSRAATLPRRGVPSGADRGAARQRCRHRCHRRDVRARRGPPDDRRSHPRGRQRPHQRGHHPPRASHRQAGSPTVSAACSRASGASRPWACSAVSGSSTSVRPTSAARDVVITVEEAPVTTVGYGAGLQGGQRLRSV